MNMYFFHPPFWLSEALRVSRAAVNLRTMSHMAILLMHTELGPLHAHLDLYERQIPDPLPWEPKEEKLHVLTDEILYQIRDDLDLGNLA